MSSYPKFRKGTRVRVRPDLKEQLDKVPRWATSGEVIFNPPPGNDYHEHPLVLWEDGRKRHVSETWLEKANPSANPLSAYCRCYRRIRVSEETLNMGAILCGNCGKEFTTE